jgi:hypothetical protein
MRCSVEELGERISAREFGEWQVFMRLEEMHPAAERLRHGQLLATMLQGPSTRASGKPWAASEFITTDPWAESAPVPSTRRQRLLQIKALNARRHR